MKKLLSSLIIWIFMLSSSFWIYYEFTNFPMSDKTIKYSNEEGNDYIVYQWKSSVEWRKVKFSEIEELINKVWYFKFFKFSYFWNNTLNKIVDENIDLSYLDWVKLTYPIAWYIAKNKFTFMIPQQLINQYDKRIIWNHYQSDSILINKLWPNYFIKINVDEPLSFAYDHSTYFQALKKINKDYGIINFQVGQNPFDRYDIENFSDDFIHIEAFNYTKVVWIIMSLKKEYSLDTTTNEELYSEDYSLDEQTMKNLTNLYEPIKNYYKYMRWVPNDLWSLDVQFTDLTDINPYERTLKYTKVSNKCYKVWFKPISSEFKATFKKSIDKNGYWISSQFCVK